MLDEDVLMMVHNPPRVFGLSLGQGDLDAENSLDKHLWKPEMFTSLRSQFGWETEKDREDIEKFNRRREQISRNNMFNKMRANFNLKMFGTPLPRGTGTGSGTGTGEDDDSLLARDALLKVSEKSRAERSGVN